MFTILFLEEKTSDTPIEDMILYQERDKRVDIASMKKKLITE